MHYGIHGDCDETLRIFICVTECYSESEQEDPEIAVETPPPPYPTETLSPVVCTHIISLLVIDQIG